MVQFAAEFLPYKALCSIWDLPNLESGMLNEIHLW